MEKMERVLDDIEGGGHDRTDGLPECIMSKILSLLHTEDLVRASFVSKRWRSLCSPPFSVLDLDFKRFSTNSPRLNHQKKRFSDFIKCMILLHEDRHHLKEFCLAIDISEFKQDRLQIDKWVSFALNSDSTTLDLDFYGGKVGRTRVLDFYGPFPVCAEPPLQSVQVLRLKLSISLPPPVMSFSWLKTVFLTLIFCPDQSIFNFIDNCPCLEELHLIECILPEDIRFEDQESKLKCLVIDSCVNTHGYTHCIRIDIPSLLRFKFVGVLLADSYIAKPINLIEAELDIRKVHGNSDGDGDGDGDGDDDDVEPDAGDYAMLHDLLTNMDNVNTLTLSSSCIQVLTNDDDIALDVLESGPESYEILPPRLPNLKYLTVKVSVPRDSVNMVCLLRSCPNLETLSIDLSCKFLVDKDFRDMSLYDCDEEEESFWRSSNLLPSKYLHRLKKVEIEGFEGGYNENIIIKCILANSLSLEEMVIYKAAMKSRCASLKKQDDKKKELKLLKADQRKAIEYLLTLRRGSSRARILLL